MMQCNPQKRRLAALAVTAASLNLALTGVVHAQITSRYRVQEIPIISNHDGNRALAINDFGVVTGYHATAFDVRTAFRYRAHTGQSTLLDPLAGDFETEGFDISYVGTVVGVSDIEPARWTGSNSSATAMGGSTRSAEGINRLDHITGYRDTANGPRAYLWSSSGGFVDLPTLGGNQGFGYDVNNSDVVCGGARILNSSTLHAFIWSSGGGITDLGTISPFTDSVANAVNEHNQVACDAFNFNGFADERAFLWDSGVRTNLGVLPGGASVRANDINDDAVIVGDCYFNGSGSRAIMWYRGQMTDLNDLIPLNSGWTLQVATGVNNLGEICGYGQKNGRTQGFVLIPNYTRGTIMCNNSDEDRMYVLNPDTGDFLRTFDTGFADDGVEIIDDDLSPLQGGLLLLADRASGSIFKIQENGDLFGTFGTIPSGQLRGIATSFGDYIVGATSTGFRAWNRFGTLQTDTVSGNFYDVFLLALGGNHKYYVMSEINDDAIEGYRLNLRFFGRTTPGGIDFPQQITTINNNNQYAVAAFNAGRIQKIRVTTGQLQGSFAVNGSPRGVIQLPSGNLLVSTTTGIHEYQVNGTFVRTVLAGGGYQYLSKCYNFDP